MWEYSTIWLEALDADDLVQSFDIALNVESEEGWEVVQISPFKWTNEGSYYQVKMYTVVMRRIARDQDSDAKH
jgi:hypothetical protein